MLMWKRFLALALAGALVCSQGGARAHASTQADRDAATVAKVKAKIARAGTGEAARVTVRLKDGTTREGYVSEAREAEFVLRDAKTDAPTVFAYADVARVEINRGRPASKQLAIDAGVTAGLLVFLSLVAVAVGRD
ncbi:MAG: hypothetical protein LC746_00085 [Acidobacteria bacterium]|nr:hypothetical protein [Acidobacteriota bacterium]